jgi:pimeloyl-ACP methyl ester carboxylesterase
VLSAFGGGRLFGEATGTAPRRVIALHGWQRDHRDFAAMLAPGAAATGSGAVGAVALDLPGFGATPPPPDGWGSAEYAAAVAAVLDDLDGPAVVVGHSFGGRVALHLAAGFPDRVGGLLLTGVPQLVRRVPPRAKLAYRAARRLNRLGLVSDERMEARRRRSGSPDYRAASGVLRDVFVRLMAEDYEEQLTSTKVPVSMVWGESDSAAPVSMAEQAAALVPGGRARLEVLPGVGHLTPTEAPAALRAALDRLLAEVAP